jgi:SAM-dependent methyltransferase
MPEPPKRNDPTEWTNVAAAYEEVSEPYMGQWADEAIRMAALLPEDRILDVATGPGTLAVRAAAKVREVVAVDYSDGMLDRLRARIEREKLTNVDARKMNGQQLELASDSFDAAFSLFGLIFFPNRGRGFSELCRILKPGGRGVVVAWGPLERTPYLAGMLKGIREALPDLPAPAGTPPAFSLQDPAVFATEMMEAGFDEVEIATRVIETPLDVDVETFFERQAPANVMVAGLQQKLPPADWARVKRAVCERIREALGDKKVLSAEANIGIGRRSLEDDE